MKFNFNLNKKFYLKTTCIFALLVYILWFIDSIVLGNFRLTGVDLVEQHIPYAKYFGELLAKSKDLLPQLNMSYGLNQNFAIFYYYGYFTPITIIISLFDNVNVLHIYNLYLLGALVLTFFAMLVLLRNLGYSYRITLFVALLTTISDRFLRYMVNQPVMILYYPIFIISLYALLKMYREGKFILFILCATLSFCFNLYLSFYIVFLQIVFLIFIFIKFGDFKEKAFCIFKKFTLSYIIASMIVAVIIITQLYLLLDGGRYLEVYQYKEKAIYLFSFYSIVKYYYYTLLGFSAFIGLEVLRSKAKHSYFLMCTIIIILSSTMIVSALTMNYTMNIYRIIIYLLPFMGILLAESYSINKNKSTKVLLLFAGINSCYFILRARFLNDKSEVLNYTYINYVVIILMALLLIVIIYLLYKTKSKIILFSFLGVYFVFVYISSFYIYGIRFLEEEKFINYMITEEENNKSYNMKNRITDSWQFADIYSGQTYIYTSLENGYYMKFVNDYIDIPKQRSVYINNNNVNSKILNAVLSNESDINMMNVKPIIYATDNIKNINVLDNSSIQNRGVYLVNALYIKNSLNTNKNIVVNRKSYELNELLKEYPDKAKYFERKGVLAINKNIENNLGAGEYIISMDIKPTMCEKEDKVVYLKINKSINAISSCTKRYYYEDNEFLFYVPVKKDEDLKLHMTPGEYYVSNIHVYFISDEKLKLINDEVKEPENMQVDLNNYFKFTMKADNENYYLATTMPYDDGFEIYVNGEKVNNELVNSAFLGAKLNKGDNEVLIRYNIPGFRLGLIISFIGSSLLYLLLREYLFKKKLIFAMGLFIFTIYIYEIIKNIIIGFIAFEYWLVILAIILSVAYIFMLEKIYLKIKSINNKN